jgi:TolB-like protein/Tfp pilus assembly protein PilF
MSAENSIPDRDTIPETATPRIGIASMGSLNPAPPPAPPEPPPGDRLNSWKEIAAYLKRDVRTLHRWEAEEGLPIHRHLHKKRGSVYAYRSELEAWWGERRLRLEKQVTAPASHWDWRKIALASIVLLLILGPSAYLVQQRAGFHAKVPDRKIMLAVLPFENLGGDPDQEYFSDGLTEETIARLGSMNSQQLVVIARSSSMHYKHTGLGVAQIGRELGVDYLLQGTVHREGGIIRVTAELVQVRDQTHLWSRSYQSDVRDVLALQGDLARGVAAEIQMKLTPAQQARLASTHTTSPEAHEAYLKGLYFWNKITEEGMREAIAHFEQAINLDPAYAEAYATLGSCYGILGNLTAIPPNESFPRNKAAALKALEIDDTVSEAHAQLGYATMFYDHDWPRAEKEFRRALELNPSNANAHRGLAQYFVSNARFDDALAEIERARELDPVSLSINSDQGWFLHFARKPDEAIAQLRRALELDPNFAVAHVMLGNAYELKHEFDRAIVEYQRALALSGNLTGRIAYLGHAYALTGRKNDAQQILKRLKELSRRGYVSPYHTALIYVGLGETDEAFAWLEKAYNDHYWMMAFLKVDPRLDPLRSDLRFQDLLRRVGLEQ